MTRGANAGPAGERNSDAAKSDAKTTARAARAQLARLVRPARREGGAPDSFASPAIDSSSARRASPMSSQPVPRVAREAARRAAVGCHEASRLRQRPEIDLGLEHAGERVAHGLAGEERPSGEHLEQHHPEGPDVGPLVDRLAPRLLRRHVGGGAEDDAGARCAVRAASATATARRTSPTSPSAVSALARPKSSTFTLPSGVSLTLAGLRSRWTMPLLVRLLERFGDLAWRSRGPRRAAWHRASAARRGPRPPPAPWPGMTPAVSVALFEAVDGGDVGVVERRRGASPRARSGRGARHPRRTPPATP